MLEIRGLVAGYTERPVLKSIDFRVGDGEVVAILGANGAGKSTLLRTITGLLRSRKGTIQFNDHNLARMQPHQIVANGVSMVPEGRQVFSQLTIMENLRLGAYLVADKARVREDLDRVFELFPRLRERVSQTAGSLSGGEQQMLAMGRALMIRPKLLLLDEPSMGLAPLLVAQIYRIVSTINQQGTAVLVVEQNARMALSVANHAYVMETGSLVLGGTAAELQSDDRVRKAYLGESLHQDGGSSERSEIEKKINHHSNLQANLPS
jgi:branched-chain amino acid transport system ATP-binding protein